MYDQPDTAVLNMLHGIHDKITTQSDRMDDIARRLTQLEIETRQGLASMQAGFANITLRLDAFEARMARIERRLDLADTEA